MNPILKNILAVIVGIIVGSAVNMALVVLGPQIIPIPAGIDVMDPESLKANMHLLESRHFIFPFLAHALGTLAGAYTAARMAASHKMYFALGIGAFFLLGGIMNIMSISTPVWFAVLDLVAAYLPMAWLGGRWATKR